MEVKLQKLRWSCVKSHHLEQGSYKWRDRCSLLMPALPLREGKKEEKERDLQIQYKNSFTTNNNINNIDNKRNKTNIKQIVSFQELCARVLASHQQLPGSTRRSQTGLSSRWELDSGMHGSESESGSEAGQ